MKKRIALVMGCLMLTAVCCLAQEADENTVDIFYSQTCPSCRLMLGALDELLLLNPDLPLELIDIHQEPERWTRACEEAGIPVWGVPRMFVDDKVYADFTEEDGELVYIPEYYGYMGYRNQISAAIEAVCGELILPSSWK